jgi:Ca2+-binding RTX toxin-like protein
VTRRLVPLLALTVVAALGAASSVSAATVTRAPGSPNIIVFAESGEQNLLTVARPDGEFVFSDPGAPLTTPGVDNLCSLDGSTATCPADGVTLIDVNVGDEDDEVTLTDTPSTFVRGQAGEDTLRGGPGPDRLIGGEDFDTLFGNDGDDTLEAEEPGLAAESPNTLRGGNGNDTLEGGPGQDDLDGGPDGDDVDGEAGDDTVAGGDGADLLSGGTDNDTILGGPGNDTLGKDQRVGVAGESDESGNDQLDGGEGDDTLRPGLGPESAAPDDDTLSGGSGRDLVTYGRRSAPLTLTLDAAANDGAAGERDDIRPDVERLAGGADGDAITGSPGADELDGGLGSDTVDGAAGNDAVDGGAGDAGDDRLLGGDGLDTLTGNAGNDRLEGGADRDVIAGGGDADRADGGDGNDVITGGPGGDILLAGGAGDDTIDGSVPALVGEDGGDALDGGPGTDDLDGGPGNDRMTGGPGVDDFDGGTGRDRALYDDKAAAVTVTLDGRANDGVGNENDNVKPDVEDVGGGGQDDTFTGSGSANALDGGSGEDYADGAGGSGDDLLGGRDRDVLRARDRRRDVVDCGSGGGADFAIVDRIDVTRRCERRDTGRSKPRVGRQVLVSPVGTRVQFGLHGMRRTVPLKDKIGLPVRSRVDATNGRVRLTAAAGRRGRQLGTFRRGAFVVSQKRARRRAVTELRLTGGSFARCRASASGEEPAMAAQRRKRTVRRLFGSGKGRFRTRGRHSAASVRGTRWEVIDRCDGTLTVVRSGTVRVTDFRRNRTIVLRAGQRYLARAPR